MSGESLSEIRELLGPLAGLAEPTEREREILAPYVAPKPHPCEKCGEEVVYSAPDVSMLHTRPRIDEWDNLYFCAKDYVPKHRVQMFCPNCNGEHHGVVPLDVQTLPLHFCATCGYSLDDA